MKYPSLLVFFFLNDTATTEIYPLSLHDALPISRSLPGLPDPAGSGRVGREGCGRGDRKSTRLNSSHSQISYALFCLEKKSKCSLLHAQCVFEQSSVTGRCHSPRL